MYAYDREAGCVALQVPSVSDPRRYDLRFIRTDAIVDVVSAEPANEKVWEGWEWSEKC